MIPSYLDRGIRRQPPGVLREIGELVDRLLAEAEIAPEVPERPGREVVKAEKRGAVTYQLERVRCGKECGGCPHGPYWYAYFRQGGRLVSKYAGKEGARREVANP